VPAGFAAETIHPPEVLRHFAVAGYGDYDYRATLARVSQPTLVVVGEHDRTTTARAARVLHDRIPGSELAVIPDAGHMSFVEEPDAYLAAVRGFLRRATG
jgi:pimeloyl-ACP methyl ester carboxylesterase